MTKHRNHESANVRPRERSAQSRQRADEIYASSTNLIIILVMMQASKKIPFEDPMTLNLVRALYVVSNLIIAGVYLYTKMQIDKKRGAYT